MAEMNLLEKFYDGFENRLKGIVDPTQDKAELIVFTVMDDITDRSGLDNEWSGIDEDIKEEILSELCEKVRKIIG
jgi:hypothetical protein